MNIGDRLRALREQKNLSQGHIEKRTGLLRCYISRVENGHTVPSVGTLEKLARALEVPLYQILYSGDEPTAPPQSSKTDNSRLWGSKGKDARLLAQFRRILSRTQDVDRDLLLHIARKLAKGGREV
jgi:transcriptional regulator with XRE-family HTH domain